jgi:hypothetical protein
MVCVSAFTHNHSIVWDLSCQLFRGSERNLKTAQVAVIYPDKFRLQRKSAIKLLRIMRLDQDIHAEFVRSVDEFLSLSIADINHNDKNEGEVCEHRTLHQQSI